MTDQICLNFETFNKLLSLALNNCQNFNNPNNSTNLTKPTKVVIKQATEYQEKYIDTYGPFKITFINSTDDTIHIIFQNEVFPELILQSQQHKILKIHKKQLPLSFKVNCGALSSGKNITNENDVFTISGLIKDTKFVIEPIEKYNF